MIPETIRSAAATLRLSVPFTAHGLNDAARIAIAAAARLPPHARDAKVRDVTTARDACRYWLAHDTPPPKPAPADAPAAGAGATVARSHPDPRVRDNRAKGGNLWTGLVVAPGTLLPAGWRRHRVRGEIFTTRPGDGIDLVASLLVELTPESFDWEAPWEDHRAKGGALWSGFRVGLSEQLLPGWTRATAGRRPRQAYTTMQCDAEVLVARLRQHVHAQEDRTQRSTHGATSPSQRQPQAHHTNEPSALQNVISNLREQLGQVRTPSTQASNASSGRRRS